jgi:hypothetical protein
VSERIGMGVMGTGVCARGHLSGGCSVNLESFLRHEEMQKMVVHILLSGVNPSPLSRSSTFWGKFRQMAFNGTKLAPV